jgi:hypothetical protein
VLEVVLTAYSGKITVSGEGEQSAVLTTALGGTGNTLGVATAPMWTAQTPNVSAVTNFSVNLDQGTFQLISATDDVHLVSASGKTTTDVLEQEIIIQNWSGNNHLLSWNGDWNVTPADVGAAGTYTLSNSTVTLAKLLNWGPNETNTLLEIVGRTILGGGAAAPPDIFDDLIAAWLLEDDNAVNQTDSVGSYTMTKLVGTLTPLAEGIENYAVSASGLLLTNPVAALKPFSATRTYTGWVYPPAISSERNWIGVDEYGGSERGWRMGYNASAQQLVTYSYDGSATSSSTKTANTFTASQWHFWAIIIKDSSYIKYTMANASAGSLPTVETVTLTGALNASTAPFSLFSTINTSAAAVNPMNGRLDEVYVFDVELTQPQLEELYALGAGKFYTAP